jgi:ABC-type dipeptide/oligopeptide/nickel transport system ATPase component
VAQLASRIAVMRAGQLVESGLAEHILRQPASSYKRELLVAVSEMPRPTKV